MAQDSETNDSRPQTAAGRLKAIRDCVAELHRRIKTERDPKAVAELRAEIGKLGELISELVSNAPSNPVEKSDFAWPADLNVESAGPGAWGADPVEDVGE